jgi:hypothetical protein
MINFIGLGAQKAGTSWVYTCLYEHPQICAPVKEIHFFSRPRFENGNVWYEEHFKKCAEGKLKGEFSTSYLYSRETPLRIRELYPEVKLIAILRNPVDRALSQYKNSIKAGHITEAVPFETYVSQEKSVLGQGMYAQQLERYYDLFPKEQILVLIYEDIKKDPEAFMKKIHQFLGIDDTFKASMLHAQVNIGRTPKSVLVGRVMHHTSEYLRKIGLDKFVHAIRKTGLPDLIHSYNTKHTDPVKEVDTQALSKHFIDDVKKLSILLDRDLESEWNIV